MTPNPYSAWRAQSPRIDFPERTVASILRDRIESRPRPATPRRWVGVWTIACLLVAAGAWAWASFPTTPTKANPVPSVASAVTVVRTRPPLLRTPAVPEPVAAPLASMPVAPSVKPAPRHKEAVSVDKGRPAIVPRCGCDPMICDCIEPQ